MNSASIKRNVSLQLLVYKIINIFCSIYLYERYYAILIFISTTMRSNTGIEKDLLTSGVFRCWYHYYYLTLIIITWRYRLSKMRKQYGTNELDILLIFFRFVFEDRLLAQHWLGRSLREKKFFPNLFVHSRLT